MKVTKVTKKDFNDWIDLGILFWSKHTKEEIKRDFKRMLSSKKEQSFICRDNNKPIGFINVSIRTD